MDVNQEHNQLIFHGSLIMITLAKTNYPPVVSQIEGERFICSIAPMYPTFPGARALNSEQLSPAVTGSTRRSWRHSYSIMNLDSALGSRVEHSLQTEKQQVFC